MKTLLLLTKLSLALSGSMAFAMDLEEAVNINPGPHKTVKHKTRAKNKVRHITSLLWGKAHIHLYNFSEDQKIWIHNALENKSPELKVQEYLKRDPEKKDSKGKPNTPKALWAILEAFKAKFKNDNLRKQSISFIQADTFNDLVNQSNINHEDKQYYLTPTGKKRLCELFTEEPIKKRPYSSREEKLFGLIEEPFGEASNSQNSSAALIEAELGNHPVLFDLPENAIQHIALIFWNKKNFPLLRFEPQQAEWILERPDQKLNTSEALWEVLEDYQKEFRDDLLRGKILSLIYDHMLPEPEQNFKNLIDKVGDFSEAEKEFYTSTLGREKIANLLLINPKKNNSNGLFSESTEDQILKDPSIEHSIAPGSKRITKRQLPDPKIPPHKHMMKNIMRVFSKKILDDEGLYGALSKEQIEYIEGNKEARKISSTFSFLKFLNDAPQINGVNQVKALYTKLIDNPGFFGDTIRQMKISKEQKLHIFKWEKVIVQSLKAGKIDFSEGDPRYEGAAETGDPVLNNYLSSFSRKLAENGKFQEMVRKYVAPFYNQSMAEERSEGFKNNIGE